MRPVGLSPGSLGLVLAWFGGAAIVRLTGATPVMLVLAAGLVLFVAAFASGVVTVSRVHVGEIELPRTSTVEEPIALRAEVHSPRPVWVDVRVAGRTVSSGWAASGGYVAPVTMIARGPIDDLELRIRSAGPIGLVWWGRRFVVPIVEHLVAPRRHHGHVRIDTSDAGSAGEMAGIPGASAGDVDGIRPWRDGDAEHAVHWPSTLRSGALVVRDRLHDTGGVWTVRADSGADEPDREAGRVRLALEQGLRTGARVRAAVGAGPEVPIADANAAAAWTALADLGGETIGRQPWWQRTVTLTGRRAEPDTTSTVSTRWWAAMATIVSIAMLVGALGYSLAVLVVSVAGLAAGAAVSARSLSTGEPPSGLVRTLTALGALGALVLVVAASGRLDNMLAFLRGPLPQVLIVLIVLHGFECRDRRTIRVALAISAVVTMYAAGFRVDDRVGWWIAAWTMSAAVVIAKLSRPATDPGNRAEPDPGGGRRSSGRLGAPAEPIARWLYRAGAIGLAFAATVAVLAVVPVPQGPASLSLPTFLADGAATVDRPGALVGPDGTVAGAPTLPDGGPGRGPAGQAGGYTGFAQTMDTSVRGSLGDDVVMRVRAPAPDYWRGQTFARFDGRTWYADVEVGVLRDGPQLDVPPALGDTRLAPDVLIDEFVQTYHLEVDMPNLVFHAYRPTRVILDADVWTRTDGALRASTVLPKGSIYTVISARPVVDEALLRRQGHIGARLNAFGREALSRYLEVPPSTTADTISLAGELAAGRTSTYDVIQAYVEWLGDNVEYDLNAPLPAPGEDAVHDFLFNTRLGFCEQIASALTVMLRTQGVPARLATGYLPGQRDRVAGVFEVRASDAHAWVEVWFPESGWQAFDPTASVPLSADAQVGTIGADLAAGIGRAVGESWAGLVVAAIVAAALTALWHGVRLVRHRRRRGRWGLLQDRFTQLADRRGAPTGVSNRRRSSVWTQPDAVEEARRVAEQLDRAAFDPTFEDADEEFREARELIGSLASRRG